MSSSCTPIPRLIGHLQPRRTWPTWGFQCLDHPPYSPDLAPSDYRLFSGLKTQLKVLHISPKWRSFLPRKSDWKDKLLISLSVLQKLEQRAKKCIELRG
jgi:hypothetical protein